MKKSVLVLLLLSLGLAGCIVAPGPGYGDNRYGDGGWGHHRDFHDHL
jgi:hypothetical protein